MLSFVKNTLQSVRNYQSRNECIVGLLAFGEGWHNNHHASPAQPSMACIGGSSISPAISSGRLNGSALRMMSTASPSPHEHGVPLAGRMLHQEDRLL
jgi:hypothetical protein